MKYTEKDEKTEVKKAFKMFLVKNGFEKLTDFCEAKGLDYQKVWRKLYKGHIEHDYVNELVALVDPKSRLHRYGKTFAINQG